MASNIPTHTVTHNKEKAYAMMSESPRLGERYDDMRTNEEIEDVSDYEYIESRAQNNIRDQAPGLPISNGKSGKRNDQASNGSR